MNVRLQRHHYKTLWAWNERNGYSQINQRQPVRSQRFLARIQSVQKAQLSQLSCLRWPEQHVRPGQHYSFRSFSSFLWDVGISSVKDFNEKRMVDGSGYFLSAQIGDFNSAAIGVFRPAHIGYFSPTLTIVSCRTGIFQMKYCIPHFLWQRLYCE